MQREQRIKQIEKEFIKLGIIDAIPIAMIVLGLHAKFSEKDQLLFEFLKDDVIVNSMFVIAVPVTLWVMYRSAVLSFKRSRIEKNTIE